jgi:hypothetical protein
MAELRSGAAAAAAAPVAPRLFDRLDAPSKERVTFLLSRVQALLPVEQDAFLQELHRQQEDAQWSLSASNKTRGRLVQYTGPSLEAVRARDRSYVVPRVLPSNEKKEGQGAFVQQGSLLQTTSGAGSRSGTQAAAVPPCSLEDLVRTPGMFGDEEVVVHLEKMSLYDKLHQNVATTAHDSAAATLEEDGMGKNATGTPPPAPVTLQRSGDERAGAALQPFTGGPAPRGGHVTTTTSSSKGINGSAPYRSNAYQVVRLAMSSPGFIAYQKPSSLETTQTGYDGVRSVLNTSGMPVGEDDLREWFDELDGEGRGALSLEEFQHFMESLERDFGVTTEYAALQRAGEQLAFDGRLSFEAFAYLVLRFARV